MPRKTHGDWCTVAARRRRRRASPPVFADAACERVGTAAAAASSAWVGVRARVYSQVCELGEPPDTLLTLSRPDELRWPGHEERLSGLMPLHSHCRADPADYLSLCQRCLPLPFARSSRSRWVCVCMCAAIPHINTHTHTRRPI